MKLRLAKRLGAAVKLGNALKLVQSKQRFAVAMASASAATFAGLMLLAGAHGEPPASDPASAVAVAADQVDRADQVERGAYLAKIGNCAGCHTEAGAPDYSGGRGIATPFGTVHATNLTPDKATGIGTWSSEDFWRAMHEGRSKDGRLLYPAFPYPYYTQVTREDSDAIFAFLRSLPPVARQNEPHALRFPYDRQVSLAVWRALSFGPARFAPDPDRSAQWNRGAYLVRGLGHCGACHSPRNLLGAAVVSEELGGAALPSGEWYAPSLASPTEAGVADWDHDQIVALLETGKSAHGSALGPMAEVVFRSTQFMSQSDLDAMAVFLKSLPQDASERAKHAGERATNASERKEPARPEGQAMELGRQVYEDHCAQCHGDQGQGAAGAYAPLAGNRAVTMRSPANVLRIVRDGGFTPSTAGNPRPYGMPPFSHVLKDEEVAAVVTYIRNAWGNEAPAVSTLEVMRRR